MPNKPLPLPTTLSFPVPPVPPQQILLAIFGIVTIGWICYTIIIVYHWITYSHAARIAIPAIIVHLVVSFLCMSFALSGLL